MNSDGLGSTSDADGTILPPDGASGDADSSIPETTPPPEDTALPPEDTAALDTQSEETAPPFDVEDGQTEVGDALDDGAADASDLGTDSTVRDSSASDSTVADAHDADGAPVDSTPVDAREAAVDTSTPPCDLVTQAPVAPFTAGSLLRFDYFPSGDAAGAALQITARPIQPGANPPLYAESLLSGPDADTSLQSFRITPSNDIKYVQIENLETRLCVAIAEGSTSTFPPTEQKPCDPTQDNQKWGVVQIGFNLFKFVARHSCFCLSVNTSSGSELVQSECKSNRANQNFSAVPR